MFCHDHFFTPSDTPFFLVRSFGKVILFHNINYLVSSKTDDVSVTESISVGPFTSSPRTADIVCAVLNLERPFIVADTTDNWFIRT